MCLYPKLITNPKYKPNIKNGGKPPECKDKRVMKVPVGCGQCMECMKQRSRGWQIRLLEEIRHDSHGAEFVTLTFNDLSLATLRKEILKVAPETKGYELDNAVATLAIKRFALRWKKKHGHRPKHWLVSELGQNNTERIHLHGIIWSEDKKPQRQSAQHKQRLDYIADLKTIWKYGRVDVGDYVNERTVNYITKYIFKQDQTHTQYKPIIRASQGCGKTIGKDYLKRPDAERNQFNPRGETKETYTNRQGFKIALPTYYRNKIYSEEEREKLWLQKIEKGERFVLGQRINIKQTEQGYYKALRDAQQKNIRLGYGTGVINWEKKEYEEARRVLAQTNIKESLDITYINTETGEIFANPSKKMILAMKLTLYKI